MLQLALILAEGGVTAADVMPAVTQVGSIGFAIWYAWYNATTTLPNMQKEHREAMKEQNALHREAMQAAHETHRLELQSVLDEMKQGRETFGRWMMGQHS